MYKLFPGIPESEVKDLMRITLNHYHIKHTLARIYSGLKRLRWQNALIERRATKSKIDEYMVWTHEGIPPRLEMGQ